MILRKWEKLPPEMQCDEVRKYYDALKSKRASLILKRLFDIIVSLLMLIILCPVLLVIAIAIKADSKGPVFYRQVRVTQYNENFRIFKFRSMVQDADKGSLITVRSDSRVTRVGRFIRKTRLDELPQLIDILRGKMTFVGTRPEVRKYVDGYTPEMMATLLLPAGVTSLASIFYKNESELLKDTSDTDKTYIEEVLPEKMAYNLKAIEDFGFFKEIKLMFMTVLAVMGKEYKDESQIANNKISTEMVGKNQK